MSAGVNLDELRLGDVEQRHAENGGVASHRLARVDLGLAAVADDDDAAVLREQRRDRCRD